MSSSTKKHDVFVSFRGEETRANFTSHLYKALEDKSIGAYIDCQLDRGVDVWRGLAKAIQDSHVSIVVFSENYACSKWCLDELVEILECRKKLGLVVIPIFYNVDPSDIRNQKGTFEKELTELLESNEEKGPKWKAALTEAANISGWDARTHRDEAHVIENVVNDVLQKLHLRCPTELKGLVGNEENCRNVELLLKSCRVIGIWGMGGIGKSTIAKILFAKHFPQYDHVCFVTNAKEYSLDKFFSTILKEEVSAKNVVGSSFHMRRLRSKKVFIVLDDVDMDSFEPLEYLCGEYEGQHGDSKLVITTRDRQLLVGRVDAIYEVQKWKKTESLKLFCSEAFKKSYPEGGYESLSESAVEYAGGVPLALKVLGSYLRSKGICFWESTIRKLSFYPNERIQKVLEVSYTALHDLEKNIFLDIVFFFREKQKDHVTRILDACGFEATSGIEVLVDKAMLTISYRNIQMHDLLQQMGLEIVRQECTADPGRRSRLKDNEARQVIEENKGTDAVQGIELDLSQVQNLRLRSDTMAKMKSLRFLRFYNSSGQSSRNTYLDLPTTLEPFSDQLRYIEWIGYPFECLPSPFCAKFLVEIHMKHGKVKQLWQGIQELDNLVGIDLSGCKQFEELPDLSKAPRLKWVNLSCCESLRYLHSSVLSSAALVTLILNGCTKLQSVKGEKRLKSLEKISVNGCSSLEEFAVSLDLFKMFNLSHKGIQMPGTPVRRKGKRKSHNLEEDLRPLTSLKEIKLSYCLQRDMDWIKYNLPSLQHMYMLKLDQCKVTTLPENIKNLGNLRVLSLENCDELLRLPKLPSSINYFSAINCTSLVSVSDLVNLANEMWGSTRFLTFKNCLKLDEHSCKLIMKSVQLVMVCAAFDNMVRKSSDLHDYSYNSVQLCLPGSKVPQEIKYRSTESFITIDLPKLSNLRGFIYSVVLSPSGETKKHGTKIICKRHLRENTRESWVSSDIEGLNTDHVYIWYDPFHCDGILKYNAPSVCFEFCVTNDKGEVDDSMCIKECGVGLISVSELPSVLEELDWDSDKKKDLVKRVELITGQRITLTSIEQSDEEENNGMKNQMGNQQGNLSEHSHKIVGTELDSKMVDSDSGEEGNERKNHYSAIEEIINSTQKEVKTDSVSNYRQNTESANVVKYEGNTERPIKQDATLHDTVESELDKENESKEKSNSVEDNRGSKEYPSSVEESIEYSTCSATKTTAKRGPKEKSKKSTEIVANEHSQNAPLQASSEGDSEDLHNRLEESIKQVVETHDTGNFATKYSSLDLENCLQQLNENPFAILDLLSYELYPSLKQLETCVQKVAQANDATTVLNEFRTLVFSNSLLKKLQDQSYRQQIAESLQKLHTYRREITKEQEAGLDKFLELYNKAVDISQDKMLTEDKQAKLAYEKRDLYNKLQNSKLKVQQFDTTISTCKSQRENLKKRQREIQEAIKKLQLENEALEKESTTLEVLYSEQQTKKNETLESVKCISISVVQTTKQLEELEEKSLSLASAYEGLKEPYERMKTKPPF
ncbi:putative disease resistance protein At4g11170 isoform X2 [Vigna unguiculata]|uniref:putative disease resistance protein At4g11170 isoform X2 n=1 Tax=Vigna unguiculata TaxID=3917 RepID=UPI001016CDB3|nr:putative disease resistance protein At4g11170 isoform X2 [Vigna unguiculata]